LAMLFNEIKCHVNTSLGLVGDMDLLHPPPVSAPALKFRASIELKYLIFYRYCYGTVDYQHKHLSQKQQQLIV